MFDKYAVVIKNSNLVNAVYFDQFRGDIVPIWAENPLYEDLEFTDAVFLKVTFWNYSGQGDFQMLAAIKTAGAITIYAFESAINWSERNGVMRRDETN